MKKVFVAFCVTCFLVSGAFASGKAVADRAYFDAQFGRLQQATAELKGGQSQIISILGNVFEGTVPAGGTLTSLCKNLSTISTSSFKQNTNKAQLHHRNT